MAKGAPKAYLRFKNKETGERTYVLTIREPSESKPYGETDTGIRLEDKVYVNLDEMRYSGGKRNNEARVFKQSEGYFDLEIAKKYTLILTEELEALKNKSSGVDLSGFADDE